MRAKHAFASMLLASVGFVVQAQQPTWSPEPYVPKTQLKSIAQAPSANNTANLSSSLPNQSKASPPSQFATSEPIKPAVVARWRKSTFADPARPIAANHPTSGNNAAQQEPNTVVSRGGFHDDTRTVLAAHFQEPGNPQSATPAAPSFAPPNLFREPAGQPPIQPPEGQSGFAPRGDNRGLDIPSLDAPQGSQSLRQQQEPAQQFPQPSRSPERLEMKPPQEGPLSDRSPTQGNLLDKESGEEAPPPPKNPFSGNREPQSGNEESKSDRKSLFDKPNEQNSAKSKVPNPKKDLSRVNMDCEKIRERALADDISKIDLDISPRFATDSGESAAAEKKRIAFAARSPRRQWYDIGGRFIVDGRLVNLSRGQVVLETANGGTQRYLLSDLSEADQAYVAEEWQLPMSCSLGGGTPIARNFMESEVQYRASGLCHKPLYFEEVQLERYGHEVGPVAQPILSTAHFFGNIAVLPYKMGIHPMNECQYALGYYRPGSCAPWTVGPVPISLRGGLSQAAAVTGLVGGIP